MAVFAGLHGAIMLLMIVSSVISREFVFSFPRSKYPPPFRRYFSSRSAFQESRKRLRLFGPYGIFGIKNPHFVPIFHIMQLVQAAFRAYQAAQLSALAPQMITVWSYAALIVAHCCSFPVIRRLCKNSPGRERLCYTLCDVLLAFVTTIVVPQFLAHKYVKLYDRKTTTFPPEVLNDNVTTATLVVEMQHILVASWTDLLTRVVMCISMLMSVTDAAGLLRKTRNTRHDSVLSTAGPSTILLTRWL